MKAILEGIDKELMKSRDKRKYCHSGKCQQCILELPEPPEGIYYRNAYGKKIKKNKKKEKKKAIEKYHRPSKPCFLSRQLVTAFILALTRMLMV
jgi:hypothetical protein